MTAFFTLPLCVLLQLTTHHTLQLLEVAEAPQHAASARLALVLRRHDAHLDAVELQATGKVRMWHMRQGHCFVTSIGGFARIRCGYVK